MEFFRLKRALETNTDSSFYLYLPVCKLSKIPAEADDQF